MLISLGLTSPNMAQVSDKPLSASTILCSLLFFGLGMGILDYTIDYEFQSHDSIMLFLNFPVQKILPDIFAAVESVLPYPHYWILAIPLSVAVWGSLGFVGYLIARLPKS